MKSALVIVGLLSINACGGVDDIAEQALNLEGSAGVHVPCPGSARISSRGFGTHPRRYGQGNRLFATKAEAMASVTCRVTDWEAKSTIAAARKQALRNCKANALEQVICGDGCQATDPAKAACKITTDYAVSDPDAIPFIYGSQTLYQGACKVTTNFRAEGTSTIVCAFPNETPTNCEETGCDK